MKKNKKHVHVFAIIRYDDFQEYAPSEIAEAITIKKVVWSREVAEQEVARLNQLNGDKGVLYFWQMTRLEKTVPEVLFGEFLEQRQNPVTIPEREAREILGR